MKKLIYYLLIPSDMINGVIYETRGVDHENHSRTLFTAFNGDLGDFVAKQVKFAVMKEKAILGGHFHDYDELFYLLKGNGIFTLKDIKNDFMEEYEMKKGSRIYIPKGIPHEAELEEDSILVGCTAEPYISPEHNDRKYEF